MVLPAMLATMALVAMILAVDGRRTGMLQIIGSHSSVEKCAVAFACGVLGPSVSESMLAQIADGITCGMATEELEQIQENATLQDLLHTQKTALPCVEAAYSKVKRATVLNCSRKATMLALESSSKVPDTPAIQAKCLAQFTAWVGDRKHLNTTFLGRLYDKCGYPSLGNQIKTAETDLHQSANPSCQLSGMILTRQYLAYKEKKSAMVELKKVLKERAKSPKSDDGGDDEAGEIGADVGEAGKIVGEVGEVGETALELLPFLL